MKLKVHDWPKGRFIEIDGEKLIEWDHGLVAKGNECVYRSTFNLADSGCHDFENLSNNLATVEVPCDGSPPEVVAKRRAEAALAVIEAVFLDLDKDEGP